MEEEIKDRQTGDRVGDTRRCETQRGRRSRQGADCDGTIGFDKLPGKKQWLWGGKINTNIIDNVIYYTCMAKSNSRTSTAALKTHT